MASLVNVKQVPREMVKGIQSHVPFHIVGFTTKVTAQRASDFIHDCLERKGLRSATTA